eukprot:EG_transcript_16860
MVIAPKLWRIKDKGRRRETYMKFQQDKKQEKFERRMRLKKERERLGDAAPPKQMPITLDMKRTPDETIVDEEDTEIKVEEDDDEWASFFTGDAKPKLLITTNNDPSKRTKQFVRDLKELFPHGIYRRRKGFEVKLITKFAIKRGFTDLIIITEQIKKPYIMIISHLPKGPTATFRISSVMLYKEIPDRAPRSCHAPELNLKGFGTRIGRRIGRLLRALFPLHPDLKGRSIATFHNQRDFIFFRRHRYIFDSMAKVRIQEMGPRFTLRLKSVQNGLFDTRFGEYEWAYHKKEMGGRDRKMFNL